MGNVPVAKVAETLGGLDKDRFAQLGSGNLTQANLNSLFSTSNFPVLSGIIANGGASSGGSNTSNYVLTADNDSNTSGAIQFAIGSSVRAQVTNSGDFVANQRIGIGDQTPLFDLTFGGDTDRKIGVERKSTANTFGANLTVASGGASVSGTNQPGGDLYLSSGTSTVTAGSSIIFQTPTPGSSGTSDNAPTVKMVLEPSGDLGIGTSTPASRLHVASALDPTMLLENTSAPANSRRKFLTVKASGDLALGKVSDDMSTVTEHVRILANGNMGIGTIAPSSVLEVSGDTRITNGDLLMNGNRVIANLANPLTLQTNSAQPLIFRPNETEAMRITSDGNVGIGTTVPNSQLSFGAIDSRVTLDTVDAADTKRLQLSGGGGATVTRGAYINLHGNEYAVEAGYLKLLAGYTGAITFSAQPSGALTERMRINPDGNVGIGTTAPTASLHLKAGAAAGGAPLKFTAGSVMTTPEPGAMEFDGTNLFYTDSSNTRRTLGTSSGLTALTGDVVATGPGSAAATIQSSAVTLAKMASDSVDSTKIVDLSVSTGDIANQAITYAKLQNVSATARLLGRSSAGAGSVEELQIGTGLSLSAGTLSNSVVDSFGALSCANGSLPYRSAGAWTCLGSTSLNTASTLVQRDSTGNFAAGAATFNALRLNNAGSVVTVNTPAAANYSLTLPSTAGSANQVLTTNGSGVLSWTTPSAGGGGGLPAANGTFSAPSISFTNSPSTGFYRPAADTIGISIAGSNVGNIDQTNGFNFYALPLYASSISANSFLSNAHFRSAYSAAGSPAFSFDNDDDTGMFGGDTANHLGLVTGGVERLSISSAGRVGIGKTATAQALEVNGSVLAVSYLTTSDKRLKKDILPLESSLEKILSLRPVKFNWLAPKNKEEDRPQLGFIAQEVKKVFPQAVHEDIEGWLRMDYTALLSPVIDGVQELARRFFTMEEKTRELEATVQALTHKNSVLEERLKRLEDRLERQPSGSAK